MYKLVYPVVLLYYFYCFVNVCLSTSDMKINTYFYPYEIDFDFNDHNVNFYNLGPSGYNS